MKVDEIDIPAAAVLRDFQQVHDAVEARAARQVAVDVGDRDGPDRVDDDVSALHGVATTNLDVRPCPDADAAGDPALTDPFAQPFGEHHEANPNADRAVSGSRAT